MTRLSPAIKGLITGMVMLITALALFYTNQPADSPLQYFAYIIYALGIIWTLIDYRKSTAYTGKFGDLFGQGFRCFIVVTLVMVGFTAIFVNMHPEFAEEGAKAYKEYLLDQKDKLPDDIEKETAEFKKQFNLRLVSTSIFGYLIVGAVVTAGVSALLTRRNQ